jgi:hypothetical protein
VDFTLFVNKIEEKLHKNENLPMRMTARRKKKLTRKLEDEQFRNNLA